MDLLKAATLQSWTDDLQFVLVVMGKYSPEEEREHLWRYLEKRYTPGAAPLVELALLNCRNWLAKNLDYLKEVGLRDDRGIPNCVFWALFQVVSDKPDRMEWEKIPDLDPSVVVSKAQEWIDAERKRGNPES